LSFWQAEVVLIEEVIPHPNADSLDICKVWDYTIISRKGLYKAGDLASFIPQDTICGSHPVFEFLGKDRYKKLKAKRLRQIFSDGLFVPAPEGFKRGDSVVDYFGLVKYEPPEGHTSKQKEKDGLLRIGEDGEDEKSPGSWGLKKYDLDPIKKMSSYFEGKQVCLTEKMEGENVSLTYKEGTLWVKSRNNFKRKTETSKWWEVPIRDNLEEKLSKYPNKAFFGEYIGNVSGWTYNCKIETGRVHRKILFFDIFDLETQEFLPYDEMVRICDELGLERAPELYRGPFSKDLYALAELDNPLGTTPEQMMEGWVVKSLEPGERLIAKLRSERYSLYK
jgi:RNA ligase (TIGR02306 family)